MNLLIVDDDVLLADFLKTKMGKFLPEATIETVDGIRSADEKLKTFNPDTFVLDLHLQPDEPKELIEEKIKEYSKIAPVVVITGAFYGPKERISMIKAGVRAFLDKNMMMENVFFDRIIQILKETEKS